MRTRHLTTDDCDRVRAYVYQNRAEMSLEEMSKHFRLNTHRVREICQTSIPPIHPGLRQAACRLGFTAFIYLEEHDAGRSWCSHGHFTDLEIKHGRCCHHRISGAPTKTRRAADVRARRVADAAKAARAAQLEDIQLGRVLAAVFELEHGDGEKLPELIPRKHSTPAPAGGTPLEISNLLGEPWTSFRRYAERLAARDRRHLVRHVIPPNRTIWSLTPAGLSRASHLAASHPGFLVGDITSGPIGAARTVLRVARN